jgi:hypothetical protein
MERPVFLLSAMVLGPEPEQEQKQEQPERETVLEMLPGLAAAAQPERPVPEAAGVLPVEQQPPGLEAKVLGL